MYYQGELLSEITKKQEERRGNRLVLGYGVVASEELYFQNQKQDILHSNINRKSFGFYHLDEQNSTAFITGRNQEIQNFYQYDAFGNVRNQKEILHNRILYTGQQYDNESNQYYLRARYYNPTLGRFTQEDVYRGDGLNLYDYCKGNPVVWYDPSGYLKITALKKFQQQYQNGEINETELLEQIIEKNIKAVTKGKSKDGAIYLSFHETAQVVSANQLNKQLGQTVEVERGVKREKNQGSNTKGSKKGNRGEIDLASGNKIWEVKPNRQESLNAGKNQLSNYIKLSNGNYKVGDDIEGSIKIRSSLIKGMTMEVDSVKNSSLTQKNIQTGKKSKTTGLVQYSFISDQKNKDGSERKISTKGAMETVKAEREKQKQQNISIGCDTKKKK
ncbi:MAG TPA: RHS repeat-associated core domain-containing protein [Candidatus Scybalomonas excrementigallinarum]|nr:RHS repeat-associated core domain-containing protein [Candidatus Scybalomonas excrementigallinarum]